MQCPECSSDHIPKNGINRQGKQNYICVNCSRQFIDRYEPHQGYSDGLRNESLTMYLNGMGFRASARVKKIHHTTVIYWVKQVAQLLPNSYSPEVTPEVGELDELETFVGQKAARPRVGERRKGMLAKTKQNLDMDSRRSL